MNRRRAALRAGLGILLGAAALVGLAGCKDKAEEMSEYPYFLKMLNGRWEYARASFKTDKPRIGFVVVLLKDIDGAVEALEWDYQGANKKEATAKLKDVAKKFREDLADKVDMRGTTVVLLPGVTAEQVAQAIERAHKHYLEFQPMVAEK